MRAQDGNARARGFKSIESIGLLLVFRHDFGQRPVCGGRSNRLVDPRESLRTSSDVLPDDQGVAQFGERFWQYGEIAGRHPGLPDAVDERGLARVEQRSIDTARGQLLHPHAGRGITIDGQLRDHSSELITVEETALKTDLFTRKVSGFIERKILALGNSYDHVVKNERCGIVIELGTLAGEEDARHYAILGR